MGHVSISHCNDALVVVWHKNKIGIDIERSDRKFNYQAIAKKYFFKTNQSLNKKNLDRSMVLNYWSIIEAAIKWDEGKISRDILEWEYLNNKNSIHHKKKKTNLYFDQFVFKYWTISIAYKNLNIENNFNILCDNSNSI